MSPTTHALAIGISGAAAVAATDTGIARIRALNGSPLLRAVARLGAAYAGARIAEKFRAPAEVSEGILAGAVLVTALDVGVSMIARRSAS